MPADSAFLSGRFFSAWRQYKQAPWGWHVVVPLGLFGAAWALLQWAWTMLDQNEYGVAMLLVMCFLVVGVGAALAIPRKTFRVMVLTFVVVISGFSGLKIWLEKGDKSWTSLWATRPSPSPLPKIEAEKPDLILKLSAGNPDPTDPLQIIVATLHNQKQPLADKIRYTFEISNQRAFSRGVRKESGFEPGGDLSPELAIKIGPTMYERVDSFPNPDQWIKGKQDFEIGPINSNPPFVQAMKLGDELVGAATVTCANCERVRGYWIFYKIGRGGWFAETSDGSTPTLQDLLKDVRALSNKEREDYFRNPEVYLDSKPVFKKQPISPR